MTNRILQNLPNERHFNLAATTNKMSLSEVFNNLRHRSYLDEYRLYVAHYNSIPNSIHEIDIDCKKAVNWFCENYKSEIKDTHYTRRYFQNNKKAEIDDVFYFIYEDLMVDFDTNQSQVRFLFRKTDKDKVEAIHNAIGKFKKRKRRVPKLSLLVNESEGLVKKTMEINRPKLKIDDNYNDDFKEIHQTIIRRLSRKNDKRIGFAPWKTWHRKNVIHPLFNFLCKKERDFFTAQYGKCHYESRAHICSH